MMPSPSENFSNNICSVLCEDTFSVLENFDFEFPFEVWYVANKMGICCNGLICLTEVYDFVAEYICLCNPSIRKVKKLCSSPIADRLCNSGEVVVSAMGFGFDEVANDYKVVRVYDYTCNFKAYEFEVHAEVYSLRKDEWKQIEASEWYFCGESLSANGAIHWLTKNVIIAFDLHDETFHKIELPKESYIAEEKCLLLYKGSLAFLGISVAENRDRTHVDIWVMKVYSATDSWTRQFNGVIEGASLKYFKFTRSGKLIFEREGNMLASWDPETLQIVDLGFKEHEHKVVDEFVESLILL